MEAAESEKPRQRHDTDPQTGPFVLRTLLDDLPLSAEGDRDDIEINCVEFLGTYSSTILSAEIILPVNKFRTNVV